MQLLDPVLVVPVCRPRPGGEPAAVPAAVVAVIIAARARVVVARELECFAHQRLEGWRAGGDDACVDLESEAIGLVG